MSFTTTENKALLWDVLTENGKFNNLSPSLQKGIQYEFDTTINEVENRYQNNTLLDKNKVFIKNFTYKLDRFQSGPQFFNDNLNKNAYTHQDIQSKRVEEITNDFNNKKREMDDMLVLKKPDQIDFSTIENDGPIQNIDAILQKTIQERNIEIKNINDGYDKKEAEKWIGEIGEISQNKVIENNTEKKISFKDEPENITLQTQEIPPTTPEITTPDFKKLFNMLKTVIANQTKIMEKLDISYSSSM